MSKVNGHGFNSVITEKTFNESIQKGLANQFKVLAGSIGQFQRTAKLGETEDVVFEVSALKGFRTFAAGREDPTLPLFSDTLDDNYTAGVFGFTPDSEIEQKFKINFVNVDAKLAFSKNVFHGKVKIKLILEIITFTPKGQSPVQCLSITYNGQAA